ncbi:MAG: endonuclease [Candidatus Aenigmatarchaeota archaeon]
MNQIFQLYESLKQRYPHAHEWWPGNKFEIVVGTILTQNTNWKNVDKALVSLKKNKIDSFDKIRSLSKPKLEAIIKPAGFYKQKAGYLKNLAKLVLSFKSFGEFLENVSREQLLSVKGVGRETADSILLYACDKPYFVIDAYTRRLLKKEKIKHEDGYESVRALFESSLECDVLLYKRFHGLIVENGKTEK